MGIGRMSAQMALHRYLAGEGRGWAQASEMPVSRGVTLASVMAEGTLLQASLPP